MKVLSASVESMGSHLALRIQTDEGTAFVEEPKPIVLEVAAPMSGPDVNSGKFPTTPVNILPDLSQSRRFPIEVAHTSQDPVVLELARQWAAGAYGDGLGPVEVPSFETADAAVWRLEAGRLVRK